MVLCVVSPRWEGIKILDDWVLLLMEASKTFVRRIFPFKGCQLAARRTKTLCIFTLRYHTAYLLL
jgi:hypothetical protein